MAFLAKATIAAALRLGTGGLRNERLPRRLNANEVPKTFTTGVSPGLENTDPDMAAPGVTTCEMPLNATGRMPKF